MKEETESDNCRLHYDAIFLLFPLSMSEHKLTILKIGHPNLFMLLAKCYEARICHAKYKNHLCSLICELCLS